MSSVRFITLGCSKNRVDSEHLMKQVEAASFAVIPEDSDETADITVLNTCGFIKDAKEESIAAIFDAVDLKNRGLTQKVLVFGCLSQRYGKDLREMIPEVDGFFGTDDYDDLLGAIGVVPDPSYSCDRVLTTPSHYAFLKISEGCDRQCSYCAIPGIRGRHRSVPMEMLVKEAELLASRGVKELVVIAQDTTYYGIDIYGKRKIAELLHRLSEVDGIEWIRLHYSYPSAFPEDLIDEMAANPKICKYLDIPLQHSSTKVLDKMRRHITGEETRQFVRKIRERIPSIVLRTTMIVGHPGETKKEFEDLLGFVSEFRFERLGAFTYSEEEGTYGAANFKDSISEAEKQRRLDKLMELQKDISLSFNASRVGTTIRVLVDGVRDGYYVCRSMYESPEVDGEIYVKMAEDECLSAAMDKIGKFFEVEIISADDYDLYAKFI